MVYPDTSIGPVVLIAHNFIYYVDITWWNIVFKSMKIHISGDALAIVPFKNHSTRVSVKSSVLWIIYPVSFNIYFIRICIKRSSIKKYITPYLDIIINTVCTASENKVNKITISIWLDRCTWSLKFKTTVKTINPPIIIKCPLNNRIWLAVMSECIITGYKQVSFNDQIMCWAGRKVYILIGVF